MNQNTPDEILTFIHYGYDTEFSLVIPPPKAQLLQYEVSCERIISTVRYVSTTGKQIIIGVAVKNCKGLFDGQGYQSEIISYGVPDQPNQISVSEQQFYLKCVEQQPAQVPINQGGQLYCKLVYAYPETQSLDNNQVKQLQWKPLQWVSNFTPGEITIDNQLFKFSQILIQFSLSVQYK